MNDPLQGVVGLHVHVLRQGTCALDEARRGAAVHCLCSHRHGNWHVQAQWGTKRPKRRLKIETADLVQLQILHDYPTY